MGTQNDLCLSDLVGRRVRKAFPGFGLFEGKIISFNPIRSFYKVEYEDGDREDMELHEVQQFLLATHSEINVALSAHWGEDPPSSLPTNNCTEDYGPASPSRPSSDVFAADSEGDSLYMPSTQSSSTGDNAHHPRWLVDSRKPSQHSEKVAHLGVPLLSSSIACFTKSSQHNRGRCIRRPADGSPSMEVKRARVDNGCVAVTGVGQRLKDRKEDDDPGIFEHVNGMRFAENVAPCVENIVKSSQMLLGGHEHAKSLSASELNSLGNSSRLTGNSVIYESLLQTHAVLPPLEHPPPSSEDFKVPHDAILDILETYSFLRSFSQALFLSPFTLKSFQQCLSSQMPTCLMDSIHLCLLQALRRNLEKLAKEDLDSARFCLRQVDWTLLDAITWPLHLRAFLATHGSPRLSHLIFAISRAEYYKISVQNKVAILNELCHHVMDTDEIRAEIASRELEYVGSLNDVHNGLPHKPKANAFQQPEHSVEGEYKRKVLEAGKEGAERKNLDECILCGMNGNLLCCDNCPAAYHARCVGVTRVMSLQGDWLCPECVVDRPAKRQLNLLGLRGGDLLGVDPYGQIFIVAWGYLLIIESYAGPMLKYYNFKDLPAVLVWLEKMKPLSDPLMSKVLHYWSLVGTLSESCVLRVSHREHNHESTKTYGWSSLRGSGTSKELATNQCGGAEGLLALSLSPTVVGCNQLSCTCGEGFHCPLTSSNSSNGCLAVQEARADNYSLQSSNECEAQQHYLLHYFNHYSLGDAAATAAANLAVTIAKRRATISPGEEQLAAFRKSSAPFHWPTLDKRLVELSKEKCGWCFSCSSPGMKRGCILNQAARLLAARAARVPGVVSPTNCGCGHLPAVAGYLLHMENSIKALLLGSWQDAGFRARWQKLVQQAEHVNDLKLPLLEFEYCLRPALLSGKWFNGPEGSFTSGAHLEDAALPLGVCKKSKHNTSVPTTGPDSAKASLFVHSWRKRKRLGKIFQRFILPGHIARTAGRQGGLKKIQGLVYSKEHDLPVKSLRCAWQARVETSCTISQLAFQVRCLDVHLRWNDLYSDSDACKLSNVYGKSWKDNSPIYLVDIDVLKHSKKKSKPMPSNHEERVWVADKELPLSLLRIFEEKLWHQIQNCNGSGWLRNCKGLKKGSVSDCKSSSAVVHSDKSMGKSPALSW